MTEEQSAEALRLLRSIADSLAKLANPLIQVFAAHSGLPAVDKTLPGHLTYVKDMRLGTGGTSFDFSPEAIEREKHGMAAGSAMPKKPHDRP